MGGGNSQEGEINGKRSQQLVDNMLVSWRL